MKTKMRFVLLLMTLASGVVDAGPTFTNPVRGGAADPHLYYHDGWYYLLFTTGDGVWVRKHQNAHEVGNAPGVKVWGWNHEIRGHVWAPEIAYLNGRWYIYASGSLDPHQFNMRMFVLEGNDQNPQGGYSYRGLLSNDPAIDESVWQDPATGQIWMTWSQWAPEQSIFIARMDSPVRLSGHRVKISEPNNGWERIGWPVNEGPAFLPYGNKMHIVMSVNGCATADYSLATLTADAGADWMNPGAWRKSPGYVFTKKPEAGVYGPGHHSVFKTPSGEYWLAYHAVTRSSGACDGSRSTRLQRFGFDSNGYPQFGEPVALGVPLATPGSSGGTPPSTPVAAGIFDGRVFDPGFYRANHDDLQRAFGGNEQAYRDHWQRSGLREGRQAHPDFDVKTYVSRYPDLAAFANSYPDALQHYLTFGINEGRSGRPETPAPAGGAPVAGRTYRIVSAHSGKSVDVAEVSRANNARIHQWGYLGADNQKWRPSPSRRDTAASAWTCLDTVQAMARN